jgi:hypothetical protein
LGFSIAASGPEGLQGPAAWRDLGSVESLCSIDLLKIPCCDSFYSIKAANSAENGSTDPPAAELLTPET